MTRWLCYFLALTSLVVLAVPTATSGKGKAGAPFALILTVDDKNGLEAGLSNQSGTEQVYLHDRLRQPCQLELQRGREAIQPVDTRRNRKFDSQIKKRMYRTLAPKASAPLHEERFTEGKDSTYGLHWGPFRYNNLLPGAYRVRLVFQSEKTRWFDSKTNKQGQSSEVWTGRISSPWVKLTLSPRK